MKKSVKEYNDNEWDWLDAELHRGKYTYDIDAHCDVCRSHLSKSDEIYKNDNGFIICMKCHHKMELEESKEPLWWAVCVRSLDDDPFDDHEYTLGYFGDWADAKKECIKDMNRYINDKLIGKDIRKYEHMKNDCIVGVETNNTPSDDFVSNSDDTRFWLIKPVDFSI